MKSILIIMACFFSKHTFAQSITLQDGIYDTNSDRICAHKLTNDLAAKEIYLQGISVPGKRCGDTDLYKWSWRKDAEYSKFDEKAVDKEMIATCTVISGAKPQCEPNEIFYDKQNNLLVKEGDIFLEGSIIRALNSKAVVFIPTIKHVRNETVINTYEDTLGKFIMNKVQE